MENSRGKMKSKYKVIAVVVLTALFLLALIVFTPLKDIFISPQTAPTIDLEIVEGPALEEATGLFRFVVGAVVSGSPEPEVIFNRNDGIGEMEPSHSLILLEEGESFLLEAVASNTLGFAETFLELIALEIEEDTAEEVAVEAPVDFDVETPDDVDVETPDDVAVETPDDVDVETTDEADEETTDEADEEIIDETEEPAVNNPPVISEITFIECNAPHDGPLLGGEQYEVHATVSDPDGDNLTYSWSVIGGSITEPDKNPTDISVGDAAGTGKISVKVDDGRGGQAEKTVYFTVAARISLPEVPGTYGGYIIKDGNAYPSASALIGDYSNNKPIRGFLSFDISGLAGKEVLYAQMSFTHHQVHNNPYDFIQAIWISSVYWGTGYIKAEHYNLQGTLLGEYVGPNFSCSGQKLVNELNKAIEAGRPRFQIMLKHKGFQSNNNDLLDTIKYGGSYPVAFRATYINKP